MTLYSTSPDVYGQFLKRNFSFQKSNRRFSKIALDQVNELCNDKIKGVSGATHLLSRVGTCWGLERRETCTTEIAMIIESLKENVEEKTTEDFDKPHYEDRSAFRRNLAADVKKVCDGLDVNPFEEINLVDISNHLYLMMKKQESH